MLDPRIHIVPATGEHAVILANNLRDGDRREIEVCGLTPKRAIWKSLRNSLYADAIFVDGDLALMFGLCSSYIGHTGYPWLLTTPAVARMPIAFIKVGRQQVQKMLEWRPQLIGYVDASYGGACSFLIACGFKLDEPEPFGINNAPFRRYHIGL